MENMKAAPVPACSNTKARIAKTIERNVEATAANCGDFPKGAAMKKDHEARSSPSKRCTTRTRRVE